MRNRHHQLSKELKRNEWRNDVVWKANPGLDL